MAWGYTTGAALAMCDQTAPPWSMNRSVTYEDADTARPIAIQKHGGKMGWGHQCTGDLLMNDFLGQHMVATPHGCIAFSSDIFDWPALVQMCAFLQVGVRPPVKTYVWIATAFNDKRANRKIGSSITGNLQNSITELLLELVDRQVYPRPEGSTTLDHSRLCQLEMAVRFLLEAPGWRFDGKLERYIRDHDGRIQVDPPTNWGDGCCHDALHGARSPISANSDWYKEARRQGIVYLSKALSALRTLLLKTSNVESQADDSEYDTAVLNNVLSRCKAAQTWKGINASKRKICGQKPDRVFDDYKDLKWWPPTKAHAQAFHLVAGDKVSEIIKEVQYESITANAQGLWEGIHESKGGMIKVKGLDMPHVWHAMQEWLRDEKVLDRVGGSKSDISGNTADFQVLETEASGAPIPYKGGQKVPVTLREVLKMMGSTGITVPVAAVSLSAYPYNGCASSTSTTKLRDAIVSLLSTMGFRTGIEDDVLALADVELSGVGVRRPEVYIKMGKGEENPYWTLRHPEWGGTRGYNVTLASWEADTTALTTNSNGRACPRTVPVASPRESPKSSKSSIADMNAVPTFPSLPSTLTPTLTPTLTVKVGGAGVSDSPDPDNDGPNSAFN